MLLQEEVAAIFNVLDLDSSGSVDADEFHELVGLLQAVSGKSATGQPRRARLGSRTAVHQS
jgi:Ca2+-binding EF-hand superfamily protein